MATRLNNSVQHLKNWTKPAPKIPKKDRRVIHHRLLILGKFPSQDRRVDDNRDIGSVECSFEDGCLHGRILHMNDLVTCEVQTVPELEVAFQESVDDYLATCAEVGKDPYKSFKGTFNVRRTPELHKTAAVAAVIQGTTLNELVSQAVAEKAKVWAEFNEDYQDYSLDGEAPAEIERVKARHMGLLSPEQIGALRDRLGVTQKQIADLLQMGATSWTRWETGRARPSRSMNILLRGLNDGKMNLNYLPSVRDGSIRGHKAFKAAP